MALDDLEVASHTGATPTQTYYVSAKARLFVRFEEYGKPTPNDAAPKGSSLRMKGVAPDRGALKVIEDPGAPPGIKRFVLVSSAKNQGAASGVKATKDAGDGTEVIDGIIPASASWHLNTIRDADQLTLKFRYVDLPIDPRPLRAIAVEFYLGTVTPENFGAWMRNSASPTASGSGQRPVNLLPDSWVDANGRPRSNLRFQGWVDKMKTTFSDGEAMIEMSCTDNTRLLIKTVAPPQYVVSKDIAIDEAIAKYLSNFPTLEGMSIEYRPAGQRTAKNPPRIKDALSGTAYQPGLGPPVTKGAGATEDTNSVWDYLAECTGAIGHIIRVDGTRIIIQQPLSLLDGLTAARQDDPYLTRETSAGRFPIRAMIWGQNISDLDIERDFARGQPKNVEVRSWTNERKNLLVARYPLAAHRVTTKLPGEGKTDADWIVKRVRGITNQATLDDIAQQIFMNQNRSEVLLSVKTKNLASFGGGNADPDLLDLLPGDNIQVEMDANTDASTIGGFEQNVRNDQRRESLMALGIKKEFADAYIKSYTDGGFQRTFRVKEMGVEWGDEGVSFEIAAVNFIVARVDAPKMGAAAAKAALPNNRKKVVNPPPTGSIPKNTPTTQPSKEQIDAEAFNTFLINKI